MKLTTKYLWVLKIVLHLAAGLPLVWLIAATRLGQLGGDPATVIQHETGGMAIKLLLATLAISPLAKWLVQPLLMRCRRLLGLWAFSWATLHIVSYLFLELGGNISLFIDELLDRFYLLIGFSCWLILLPLAMTSFQRVQRKLGPAWQTLHNFIYLAIVLASIHGLLSVKFISGQTLFYAVLTTILLILRYKKFIRWW